MDSFLVAMSSESVVTTSRVWSCQTLNDGAQQLLEEAEQLQSEEKELERMIQDSILYHT